MTEHSQSTASPLAGLVVLDLSVWGLGPLATVNLADLGADVIKIESPDGGDPGRNVVVAVGLDVQMKDGRNAFFEVFNRGKRSVVIDLKHPEGAELLRDLVRSADALMENRRPGALDKLGLGYEALSEINPRLVYASMNGYGPLGAERTRPAFDYIAQSRSGYMWTMGSAGDPPVVHTLAPADVIGSIVLVEGILAGLVSRSRTGRGSLVQSSQIGAMIWASYFAVAQTLFTQADNWPRDSRKAPANPVVNNYECADGVWMVINLLQSDRYFPAFCQAIGRPDLLEGDRYASHEARRFNSAELVRELSETFAQKTSDEWTSLLRGEEFVFDVVQRIPDLPRDPAVMANDYVMDLEYGDGLTQGPVPRVPFHFDGVPVRSTRLAPGYGEHTWEVLMEKAGKTSAELEDLSLRSVIG
jgi:crotonobetainyl-CoA:carnitine CoA-transferase CaiB-like acyl-CoA transferase